MEGIRLATEAEIEKIKNEADLSQQCSVWTWPLEKPMTAVVRQAFELDPIYYGDNTASRKAMFVWGIENVMRALGVSAYYFNVAAEDEEYQKVVTNWGAEPVSKKPEIRYKKAI